MTQVVVPTQFFNYVLSSSWEEGKSTVVSAVDLNGNMINTILLTGDLSSYALNGSHLIVYCTDGDIYDVLLMPDGELEVGHPPMSGRVVGMYTHQDEKGQDEGVVMCIVDSKDAKESKLMMLTINGESVLLSTIQDNIKTMTKDGNKYTLTGDKTWVIDLAKAKSSGK